MQHSHLDIAVDDTFLTTTEIVFTVVGTSRIKYLHVDAGYDVIELSGAGAVDPSGAFPRNMVTIIWATQYEANFPAAPVPPALLRLPLQTVHTLVTTGNHSNLSRLLALPGLGRVILNPESAEALVRNVTQADAADILNCISNQLSVLVIVGVDFWVRNFASLLPKLAERLHGHGAPLQDIVFDRCWGFNWHEDIVAAMQQCGFNVILLSA